MAKVFILNKASHDFSDAARFGEIVYISEGLIKDRFNTSTMYRVVVDCLEENKAIENDYIVLTSLSILCSVASAVFAKKFGRINLLIFKDGKYIERTLILEGEKE